MPELPDVVVYCEALNRHYAGQRIERIEVKSPFVVRTVEPEICAAEGKCVLAFQRLGKRVLWELDGEMCLVMHLMIAGRLHRKKSGTRPKAKTDLVAFHFPADTLMLTEASPKKRASIFVLTGAAALSAHDPGGLDVLACTRDDFARRITSENHTLKRSLTDPRLLDGIGNSFSDEILHAARLSPILWTSRLTDDEITRLFDATRHTLTSWIERLRTQTGDGFPEKVTAFRPEMAVHGKYGQPCPVCDTPIARIRYSDNETNYCPRCQTEGRLLADRSLSRLLKDDWPRSIDD